VVPDAGRASVLICSEGSNEPEPTGTIPRYASRLSISVGAQRRAVLDNAEWHHPSSEPSI